MVINSTKVIVKAEISEIHSFLNEPANIIHLLPQDKVEEFKATDTQCSFKIQGGVVISLINLQEDNPQKIAMKSGEKSPFPFTLDVLIEEQGDHTQGYIKFDGEVNMFLKMMVEKPLTNLFNYMSEQLAKRYEE